MRTIAEVVEDIKNGTWGSDIEYQSECEKLHKLCDEILEIEKAKMERIVAELEDKIKDVEKIIVTPPQDKLDEIANDTAKDFIGAWKSAIKVVRKGGVE